MSCAGAKQMESVQVMQAFCCAILKYCAAARSCYAFGVVKLVTQVNGVSSLLFHVEHSPGEEWHWRWRITAPDGLPAAYLEWREGTAVEPRVIFQPEVTGCTVEAQWRPDGDGSWRQAALHVCATGVADFKVTAGAAGFDALQGWDAMAVLPCGWIANYHFNGLRLAPHEERLLTGLADGAFPDNVLLAAGEFHSQDGLIRVENITPSRESLRPVPGVEAKLEMNPGCFARNMFVVHPRPDPSPTP